MKLGHITRTNTSALTVLGRGNSRRCYWRYGDKLIKKLVLGLGVLFLNIHYSHAIEIDNFKSGLVCGDPNVSAWVCHEAEKIYITGQGKCTYNGESKPCTWHGFEFDYKNHKKGDVINCIYKTTHAASIGNPKEIIGKDLTEKEFELTVPYGSGYFFNPQYSILATFPPESHIRKEGVACFFED